MNMSMFQVTDFNLQHTLECGQAFRWKRDGDGYLGVVPRLASPFDSTQGCPERSRRTLARDSARCQEFTARSVGSSVWYVSQDGDTLFVETDPPVPPEEIVRYFSLDLNLQEIFSPLRKDPVLEPALKEFWGLRILRQDPWECLGSYIFSSFNNVKRITSLVENLSIRFGNRVGSNGTLRYTFPTAERLAPLSPRDLYPIRPGFRDKYLLETAKQVAEGKCDLKKLDAMETAEAKEALLALPGVGEKVAECILLFAYGKKDAFPIDVWVERALRRFYFRNRRRTLRNMQRFARRRFGKAAGYAQEYLYAYAREYL